MRILRSKNQPEDHLYMHGSWSIRLESTPGTDTVPGVERPIPSAPMHVVVSIAMSVSWRVGQELGHGRGTDN